MSPTHGGPWGRERKSARQGAAEIVFGMGVAAGEVGAAEPDNDLDLIGRPALRQQRPCYPQIHDAPVRRGKALRNLPAVHPGLVEGGRLGRGNRRGSARLGTGAAIQAEAEVCGLGKLGYRCGGGLQQLIGMACQAGMSIHHLHPGSAAVAGTSLGLLVGESGESAQVSPVGTGTVAAVGQGQVLTDRRGDVRRQGSGTDMHPGLQMRNARTVAGTGLEYHAGFMSMGTHGRHDGRLRVVQVDQDVAGVG